MQSTSELTGALRLPAMQAPMFLISGPEMVINACRSGIIGCFPTQNARSADILDQWMTDIKAQLRDSDGAAPWAVNIIVHPSYPRRDTDIELILKHQPPIVVTALGSPKHVVEQIHSYGGIVIADVISPTFARKAIAANVDGLVLVAAGAGGHTGYLSPFVFVNEIRKFWDGLLIIGGGISSGKAIHAAQVMGADLAYLGTVFIPTDESMAVQGYKEMVVAADADAIVTSDAITGVKANWLRQSLINGGYDPDTMPAAAAINFADKGSDNKRWKDVWSAGQGVGGSETIATVNEVVERLLAEYTVSCSKQ